MPANARSLGASRFHSLSEAGLNVISLKNLASDLNRQKLPGLGLHTNDICRSGCLLKDCHRDLAV